MQFMEEEMHMANKQMTNSLYQLKNADDDPRQATNWQFLKGHHICGDSGRLLNMHVCKAGNDSIKEFPSSFCELQRHGLFLIRFQRREDRVWKATYLLCNFYMPGTLHVETYLIL